jgi:hypothetical protein
MSDLSYHIHRHYRTAIRKLRTAIQGPKVHPPHIRAAHYFSDGWVLNFWQVMDPKKLNADLQQIIADGFNTIILVIPWREFQSDQFEPKYDPFYIKQLDRVMAAADRHGLSVIARVAYSHQLPEYAAISGLTQAQRLLTDLDTHSAWLAYLARVFEICHGYRSFRYGFLSWEEFWHAFARWQHYPLKFRTSLAEDTGFNAYLLRQGLSGVAAIPKVDEPEHKYFHAFINQRIEEMYEDALAVFPRLTMEIRVDKDKLLNTDGEVQWLGNDTYTGYEGTRMTYWAPFMGAANEGETLQVEQAIELLAHMLNEVTGNGDNINHVVDQFNFVDNAPKFRGIHAEIETGQVPAFLQAAAPLLAERSSGYGIWAYRDYRQNLIYNARFLMGIRGWTHSSGQHKLLHSGGIRLGQSATLRQVLPARVAGLQSAVPFNRFTLQVDVLQTLTPDHRLSVKINSTHWLPLELTENGTALGLEIPVERAVVLEDGIVIELRNEGASLKIYTLSLYHYVFRGAIRLESGAPSTHHAALVNFNTQLQEITAELDSSEDQTA